MMKKVGDVDRVRKNKGRPVDSLYEKTVTHLVFCRYTAIRSPLSNKDKSFLNG
jgi:hypothetical protein